MVSTDAGMVLKNSRPLNTKIQPMPKYTSVDTKLNLPVKNILKVIPSNVKPYNTQSMVMPLVLSI
jgi:hypothetical protein